MKVQTQAEIESTLGDQYAAIKAKIEGYLKNKEGDSPMVKNREGQGSTGEA